MTKTAVVTGASTGIGAALAGTLAANGWRVLAIARREDRLKQLALTHAATGEVVPIVADLAAVDGIGTVCAKIGSYTSHVDLLANIAGVWHGETTAYYGPSLWELSEEEILQVMNVGITASMLLARGVLPLMLNGNEEAHIVNLSGTFNAGGKGWIHYYTSKKALEFFTLALADETKGQGVRVNCVSPADTATEAYIKFFPEDAEGALKPEEIAEFIIHLSDESMRHINGQIIELRA